MSHDGSEVSDHVLGLDRLAVQFRKMDQERRLDVRLRCRPITPQWIRPPTEGTLVMMQIRN
jgi:hypothetical protein